MAENKTKVDVKKEKSTPLSVPEMRNSIASLRQEIDRLFDHFNWPDFRFPLQRRIETVEPIRSWNEVWSGVPAMDLIERNGEYEVQAELPGLNIADIDVKLSDGMLTIKGEKTIEHHEDDEDYHLQERGYGAFQRSFRLPGGIDADKVAAKFENGVLTVTMPKTAEAKQKERKVEVKAA